ncbi:330_t:CDS:2 [Paraglomus brasilianum]|uniref:330_t:CDS:1 n=1 Tax=Paraglomus brasilianum TaxID=144538 RepID=A0A9N9FGX8_9GLOM|nr:330_t:CDS:2 [Paraglomus brasilianum]
MFLVESATSGRHLFRLLSRPDVVVSSVTADDVFDCYLREMANDTYIKIYDSIRKDVTDILESGSINESAKCFLRKISDNWKTYGDCLLPICSRLVAAWGLLVTQVRKSGGLLPGPKPLQLYFKNYFIAEQKNKYEILFQKSATKYQKGVATIIETEVEGRIKKVTKDDSVPTPKQVFKYLESKNEAENIEYTDLNSKDSNDEHIVQKQRTEAVTAQMTPAHASDKMPLIRIENSRVKISAIYSRDAQ